VDDSPALVVENAPEGAVLVVDGLVVGEASAYSGEHALSVRPGRHMVEVRSDGIVLLKQEVYVSGGATKTLTVPGGVQ
jgi:hypothetical protein